jgi:DNA-binding CsgD family transcriptional regulator
MRPWVVAGLVVVFFGFAGLTVASTATALVAISETERYSAVTAASFFLVCGVSLLIGVLFAVAGKGASRLLLAGATLALGFGAVHPWSPSPELTSILAPVGLIGFFWVLASFPGVRPKPRWLRWVVAWLAAWSCVCFGIPPIRDAIASGDDPWSSLVGPGFLTGLAAIVVGKALDFRRVERTTRRWYLVLGVVIVLCMVGAGISAVLTATGHFAVGNGVDDASALMGNVATAAILAIVGAAAIKEGYYGVAVTEEQRRAAWRTMFPEDPAPPAPFDLAGLTYRERQLLPLLATGTPTAAMARRLGISEKTVRNYLSGLYSKLGAADRATGALAARGVTTESE